MPIETTLAETLCEAAGPLSQIYPGIGG